MGSGFAVMRALEGLSLLRGILLYNKLLEKSEALVCLIQNHRW